MKTTDFYFDLPEELIAQQPLINREESRLMVVDKQSGEIQHRVFKDVLEYFREGDCLVLNNTKVMPARLFGMREESGAKVEFLLLKRIQEDRWEVLVKPGKKARIGDSIVFGEGLLKAEIIGYGDEGSRLVNFQYEGVFEQILDQIGTMPLPHYIKAQLEDRDRYQTVYAKHKGSAAAPTAGLHFTHDLLHQLKERGVNIAYITLHVGLGTFRPVKSEDILEHKMHAEYYEVSAETADLINYTKNNGGRVIAVGTTSTRTLESIGQKNGRIEPSTGWTNIFIYPGYEFKVIDGLITNFHLPESTLIMLVSAFSSKEITMHAYKEAVKNRYRFYSFGDAMLMI